MTPGLAVFEASGLSLRRFGAIVGVQASRSVIARAGVGTIAAWLERLRDAGIALELRAELRITADGVTWTPAVHFL